LPSLRQYISKKYQINVLTSILAVIGKWINLSIDTSVTTMVEFFTRRYSGTGRQEKLNFILISDGYILY